MEGRRIAQQFEIALAALRLPGQFVGQAADDHLARRAGAEQEHQERHGQDFSGYIAKPMHIHSTITIRWPGH